MGAVSVAAIPPAGAAYGCKRSTGCSALPFNLGSKGLRYYLPVSHNKCIGSEFVRTVLRFGRPNNITVIAIIDRCCIVNEEPGFANSETSA
jgi:hypothetical protein